MKKSKKQLIMEDTVILKLSKDETTLVMNLIDKELERILSLTNNSMGESTHYNDKTILYRLCQLFNI